jgi:hypothetical protein
MGIRLRVADRASNQQPPTATGAMGRGFAHIAQLQAGGWQLGRAVFTDDE